jgi:hypothetical protein
MNFARAWISRLISLVIDGLVWNITGDFFKTIYEQLQGVYQRIVDKALGGFSHQEDKDDYKRELNRR